MRQHNAEILLLYYILVMGCNHVIFIFSYELVHDMGNCEVWCITHWYWTNCDVNMKKNKQK